MIDDFGDECRNEVEALRKENADLRARWEAIPWKALASVYHTAQEWYSEHLDVPSDIDDAIAREWLHENTPAERSE